MNARSFLVSGLLAGLLAGLATFFVAHQWGEPYVDAAIAVEEAHSQSEAAFAPEPADHHHEEDGTVVSRENQSTWGLLTGTMAMSLAFGGLIGLISAGVAGRIGRLRATQTTGLAAALGFLSYALVPFLKYPPTPPAVGDPDTIGHRTDVFFVYVGISVLAMIGTTGLAARLLPSLGTYRTLLISGGIYVAVAIVASELMPTVNEIGDFPADILWGFRRSSLTTLVTMWGSIGLILVGLVGRQQKYVAVQSARRELAASL